MSRPQSNSSTSQYTSSHVVNGGLIDFHDNLQRGVTEYQPAVASSYMPAPFHQGAAMGQQCITGPPAYLHVNGVTYRPIGLGDAPVTSAAASGASTPQVDRDEPRSSKTAVPAPLTQEEIEASIARRVQSKVDEFMASRTRKAAVTTTTTRARTDTEAEARAVRLLRAANETMRSAQRVSYRPDVSYENNW